MNCGARAKGNAVTPETTTQELKIHFLHGWLASFVLHGLLVLSFLSLFRHSPTTFTREPFHWDVALVQSTEMAEGSIRTPEATEQTALKRTDRTPIPARANRPIRNAASSTDRVASVAPMAKTPVEPAFQPVIPSSAVDPAEPASAPPSDEPTSNWLQASDPPPQETEAPIGSMTQELPRPETVAATPSSQGSTPAMEAAQAQQASLSAMASDIDPASMPRLDYGWLQQAIFRRLEELKRSSRPLLEGSRPLKVTVKAVVSREGTLLDSTVLKSSGLDRIDQEAMALVQRVFPLQLDRSLDRGQIVMRIPITYSQE